MGLQGVELILLGYNTPTHNIYHPEPWHLRMFHHRLVVQAGAYQNGCWVVAAAKAGAEDGHGMIGGSCIVVTGEIVSSAMTEGDELIVANCDLTRVVSAGHDLQLCTAPPMEHYRLIERTGAETPRSD
jgi:predicted amidohydrolase